MTVTLYHNPRCGKSRETLALLRSRGIEPQIVEYLKNPLTASEIETLLAQLGIEPRALLRTGEAAYREAGLADPALGREALIAAMVQYPILIQRPIVVAGGKAAIGRPPEAVLSIL